MKILNFLKGLIFAPTDKLLHFIGGMVIYLLVLRFWGLAIAFGVAIFIGIAKEVVWDKWMGRGTPEIMDVIYVLWGAMLAMLLTMQYS